MVGKKIALVIGFIIWTLGCIYGTYNNTVEHAHIVSVNGAEYNIQYDNTGDVMSYSFEKEEDWYAVQNN